MTDRMIKILEIFLTRLETLDKIIETGATQWSAAGKNPDALMAARLADDMLPLSHQILFSCHQPSNFLSWSAEEETHPFNENATTIDEGRAMIVETIERLRAATIEENQLDKNKLISLPGNLSFTLVGRDYVDDWLLPNFYFHVTTAYDILRQEGVALGKKDYMAFLMPTIMRQMNAAQTA